jgi:non-homologous end joining protein Ku
VSSYRNYVFLDEIKAIPKPFTSIETNQAELEMAKKLINNMTSDFKPELYKRRV